MSNLHLDATVKRLVSKTQLHAMSKEPFYASIGFSLNLHICAVRPDGGQNLTAAVDGKTMFVNPDFFNAIPMAQAITLYVHECEHVSRGHHLRRGDRDHMLFNAACDHVINLSLLERGYAPIDFNFDGRNTKWLCDEQYKGWHEERVYMDLLRKRKERDKQREKAEEQEPDEEGLDGDPGVPGDEPGDSSGDDESEENNNGGTGTGTGEGDVEEGADGTHSGEGGDAEPKKDEQRAQDPNVDGQPEPGDNTNPSQPTDPGGDESGRQGGGDSVKQDPEPEQPEEYKGEVIGEVLDQKHDDGTDLSNAEKEEELSRLGQEVMMNKYTEISSGDSPSTAMSRTIGAMIHKTKNWRAVLREFIKQSGKVDGYSYSKQNRRAMANKMFAPGELKSGMEWLVMALDVSGSMSEPEHLALAAEMEKIRKFFFIKRLTIVPFNHVVQERNIKEIKPGRKMPTDYRVGGGTQFACVFDWINKQRGKPSGVIIFTDLDDDHYGKPPRGVPILWASSHPIIGDKGSRHSNVPPFGRVVEIMADEE